ncbi:hypothetical protein [Promicromonospora sp. NPDC023987]|uniref:hypothetical protein n=1 Tax=Promicromonospora sp. NPDC023987 TaxID=3155360 RepID=UPI0033C1C818
MTITKAPDSTTIAAQVKRLLRLGIDFQAALTESGEPRLTPGQFEVFLGSLAWLTHAPMPETEHPARAALMEAASALTDVDDDVVSRWVSVVIPSVHHAHIRSLEADLRSAKDLYRHENGEGSRRRLEQAVTMVSKAEDIRDTNLVGIPAVAPADVAEVTARLDQERRDLALCMSAESRATLADITGPEEADQITAEVAEQHTARIAALENRLSPRTSRPGSDAT